MGLEGRGEVINPKDADAYTDWAEGAAECHGVMHSQVKVGSLQQLGGRVALWRNLLLMQLGFNFLQVDRLVSTTVPLGLTSLSAGSAMKT